MAIPTPETWARFNSRADLFTCAAQDAYVEHLSLRQAIEQAAEDEVGDESHARRHKCEIAGIQTIVFAGMCFESAIYDYAALHLGDEYVRDYLDRIDLLSKWVVCLRLIADYEIATDRAPYASLKQLIKARNRLVHSKSEPARSDIVAQIERLRVEGRKFVQDVDNAFRALVLMSAELEKAIGIAASPLRHFSEDIVSTQVFPAVLKPIVDNCRRIVLAGSNARA